MRKIHFLSFYFQAKKIFVKVDMLWWMEQDCTRFMRLVYDWFRESSNLYFNFFYYYFFFFCLVGSLTLNSPGNDYAWSTLLFTLSVHRQLFQTSRNFTSTATHPLFPLQLWRFPDRLIASLRSCDSWMHSPSASQSICRSRYYFLMDGNSCYAWG